MYCGYINTFRIIHEFLFIDIMSYKLNILLGYDSLVWLGEVRYAPPKLTINVVLSSQNTYMAIIYQ
jgi:hypothetical protein